MNLSQFLDIVKKVGLEFFQKYYAVYPGIVEDNEDPEQRGRIKISLPSIFGAGKPIAQWVLPMGRDIAGSGTGSFFPPYVGDVVDVMFENGNINAPRYMGGFWSIGELPDEFLAGYPNVKGWVFKSKQKILVDESAGKLKISFLNGDAGSFVVIDDTSGSESIYLVHSKGSVFQMNKDGSIISATPSGNVIFQNEKEGETTITAPDGSFIKIGKGIVLGAPGGKSFINITEDTVEINGKNIINTGDNLNSNTGNVGLGQLAVLSAVLAEPLEAYLTLVQTALTNLGQVQVPPPSVFNLSPVTGFKSLKVKMRANLP